MDHLDLLSGDGLGVLGSSYRNDFGDYIPLGVFGYEESSINTSAKCLW